MLYTISWCFTCPFSDVIISVFEYNCSCRLKEILLLLQILLLGTDNLQPEWQKVSDRGRNCQISYLDSAIMCATQGNVYQCLNTSFIPESITGMMKD